MTLHERLVIRPVFRFRETGGSPVWFAFRRTTSADIICQRADVTPVDDANQLASVHEAGIYFAERLRDYTAAMANEVNGEKPTDWERSHPRWLA